MTSQPSPMDSIIHIMPGIVPRIIPAPIVTLSAPAVIIPEPLIIRHMGQPSMIPPIEPTITRVLIVQSTARPLRIQSAVRTPRFIGWPLVPKVLAALRDIARPVS